MKTTLNAADIICFGADWNGHPTSTHHLVRRLAQHHRVLWINSLGMRTPEFSSRQDLARIWSRGTRLLKHAVPRKVGSTMWCMDPLYVPIQDSDVVQQFNQKLLGTQIRWTMRALKMHRPIVLTALPNCVDVLPHIDPVFTMYYCLDDYARMPGVDSEVMSRKEQELAEQTQLILISGEHLREHLEGQGRNIAFLPHGVDVERFVSEASTSSLIDSIQGPKIGFFGALDTWLDLELVATVARRKPEWQFPIVGPTRIPLDELEQLENVHLLGAVPYEDIPSIAKSFDVGLLPFKVNDFTKAINPLKLREYFAAGLPAVSTSLPEVEKYTPLVSIADRPDAFIEAIQKMLDSPPTTEALQQAVHTESWDARAQDVMSWMQQYTPTYSRAEYV